MIDGSDRGKTVFLCRNRECVKHRLDARQGARSSADRKKHRVEKTFRERLFATIRKKVNALPGDKVTRLVATRCGADWEVTRNGLYSRLPARTCLEILSSSLVIE